MINYLSNYFCYFAFILLSVCLNKASKYRLEKELGHVELSAMTWIGMGITGCLLWKYGLTGRVLSSILFFHVLLFASVFDIKTHSIPDCVHLLIVLTGLSSVHWGAALLGFILVPLPLLLAALASTGGMGGGDIKFMAACGFVLGVSRGYIALISGLLLAIQWRLCFDRKKKEGIPLIPYFTCGCFLSLFI